MSYLSLKCTEIDFSALGELTALPQTPYLDLRGPTSKGRGREEGGERERGKGKGGRKGVEGRVEGEGRGGEK